MEGLISDLALILLLGAGVTVLFKWLRQPVVLGYIVAGFLASPHFAYLPTVTSEHNIEFWAQIGIIVLLFSLGLEFSFKKLLRAGGSAVVTALFIICGMMAAGYGAGLLLGFSGINCLFLGGMLSMSSTTIIIKAFTDLGLKHKKFASLVLAVLIVEDLFAVVLMVILSSIAVNKSVEGGEMLFSISKLAFFLVIWFLVGVFVLPSVLNGLRKWLNSETLLVVSMGLCLGMAVFSVACGFSLALGAFVMGSILAGTSFAERIEHVVAPVKDLFGAVFFISVGMMVNPSVLAQYWLPVLLLSVVVIAGMIFFGSVGMLLTGQSLRVAMQSGFSLTQIGEFSFIIATLGMGLGVLEANIYPIIVAVSVITTFTTPYFIRFAEPSYNFVERHLPSRLRFLIDRYSDSAVTENASRALWRTLLRRYLWRVALYMTVLIAVMLIALNIALPWLQDIIPDWARVATTAAALIVMAPFLVAMTFPASARKEREMLRDAGAHATVPLIVMGVLRLMLAMGVVVYLLSALYSLTAGWCAGVALFILVLFAMSSRVRNQIKGIEDRFMDNLNERELRRSGRRNNLVADIHLAFVTVGHGCQMVGERLRDSGLRKKWGVSVSSIQRGGELMMVPGPDARIFPGDVLGVIGTEQEIQALLPELEATAQEKDNAGGISDVRFTSVVLGDASEVASLTVAQADMGRRFGILLVAVERDGNFLQPTPQTQLHPGDVLWVVADSSGISKLAAHGS